MPDPSLADPGTLRVRNTRVLRGPSLWRQEPVLAFDVQAPDLDPGVGAVLAARVRALLDGAAPGDGGGVRPGADPPAAAEGGVPHLLAGAVLALRALAAPGGGAFAAVERTGAEEWRVAVEAGDDDWAFQDLRYATQLVGCAMAGAEFRTRRAVQRLREVRASTTPPADAAVVLREAARRGLPAVRLDADALVRVGWGRRSRLVRGALSAASSAIAVELARDPEAIRQLLMRAAVPVCIPVRARDLDQALRLAQETGYPVRLEGPGGAAWRAGDEEELRAAWAACGGGEVELRSGAGGPEHRVLVVGGQACGVGAEAPLSPEVRRVAERAARVAGLPVVAVHVHVDEGAPGGRVRALDPAPRLGDYPAAAAAAAAAAVLEALYPGGASGRIPVIGITGTNGKTTTARLTAHLLACAGRTVGLKATDCVAVGGRTLFQEDLAGALALEILLGNADADAAVVEYAHAGLLTHGVGIDGLDVGVVLNVSEDHLGTDGIHTLEEMARLKGVVAAGVRTCGWAVLNADDERVAAMRHRTPGRVVLFSRRPRAGHPLLRAHPGLCACVEDGAYVLHDGGARVELGRVEAVPLTYQGRMPAADENVLAAAAAAYVQGVSAEDIRAGLLSFFPSPEMNRGRMNLLRVAGRWVLVDYAHNLESVRTVADFARAFPAGRRLAVVGMAPNRRDQDIRACGRALAPAFDHVIVRERDRPSPLRPDGEVARLLAAGLEEGGLCRERQEVHLREQAAVDRALAVAGEGDLVVLLVNNVDGVLEQVQSWPAPAGAAWA
ncbi:MAG TPA: Mur ligase family protein [Longimicrobium sp.]|nr:Mur ligase family protein [Longimicrobium sp.]